jgi:hypothetical protein
MLISSSHVNICCDTDVQDLWFHMCTKPLPVCAGDIEVYTPPDGVHWLHDKKERWLLVRQRVKYIWNRIFQHNQLLVGGRRCVIVLGTPGIGKSWTLNYFMLRLAELPTVTVVLHLAGQERAWLICKIDGSSRVTLVKVSELSTLSALLDVATWYLYDPGEGEGLPAHCEGMTVVTSSPNPKHFKNVAPHKRPSGESIFVFLTVLSLVELKAARPFVAVAQSCSEADLERNYTVCGGVLRQVFGDHGVAKAYVDDGVKNSTVGDLQSLGNQFHVGGVEEAAPVKGKWSHRLLHGYPDPTAPSDVTKVSLAFASDYAAKTCMSAVQKRDYDTLHEFMESVIRRTGGVRMISYEVWIQWLFAKRPDRRFDYSVYDKKLQRSKQNQPSEEKKEMYTIEVPLLTVVEAGTAVDLVMQAVADALKNGRPTLVCPTSDNHEANDHYAVFPVQRDAAAVWMVLMLQDTNQRHHAYHPWKLVEYAEKIRLIAPQVPLEVHYCIVAPPNAVAGLQDAAHPKNRGKKVDETKAKATADTVNAWGVWYVAWTEDHKMSSNVGHGRVKRRKMMS